MLYQKQWKNMDFTIKQAIEEGIKSGLPSVFIDSIHFLNN